MIQFTGNIAVSGFQAAERRLANSANNVANQNTTGSTDATAPRQVFIPQDVVQQSAEAGGVTTQTRERTPATTSVYAPEDPAADANGLIQAPNVSPERELIDQQFASYDAKANLKSLKAYNETVEEVLNIVA